ncbi:MAG TPA: hypothetical protein VGD69_19560 [Herpetosiphonaceae bacterium]
MRIDFALIGEGSSDSGLIEHLSQLCLEAGADEVTPIVPDLQWLPEDTRRTIEAKLRATIRLQPNVNLIFIHRDADSRDPTPRYAEITRAVEACALLKSWVAVVPVQETEAWLLLDEAAIRSVAGKPNGRANLNLPRPRLVENIADPKEYLRNAIVAASELKGRRLNDLRKNFSTHRQILLRRLPIDGPIRQVPSWVRMRDDIIEAVENLRAVE